MKQFVGITLFILLGLITAFVVGFRPTFSQPLPWDSEQTGLKERIIIKFSHVVAENTPKGLAAEHFARLVKEKTNDRVEIQVFPNGMLYSENTESEALQRGDIQMIAPSFSNLTNISPAWLAMDLPFAFLDQKAVDEALNGDIGRRLFQTLVPHKMVGVAYWNNGFKQMTSNMRPLMTPKDFQGQIFRILPSTMIAGQFQALGARTINYPFNEVYRKLENGTVDGQENTISNIYTKRLFKVQKYMTISNHGYLGYAVIFNKPFLDDLPSELRTIIQEALNETTNWINNQSLSMQKQQFGAILRSSTIEIHELTDSERRQWMSSMEPLYSQYAEEIGENLVNEIIELRDRDLSLITQ